MLERGRIDEQRVRTRAVGEGAHVREVDLLRAPQMVDERAGRRDRGQVPIEAEPFQAAGPQLRQQAAAR